MLGLSRGTARSYVPRLVCEEWTEGGQRSRLLESFKNAWIRCGRREGDNEQIPNTGRAEVSPKASEQEGRRGGRNELWVTPIFWLRQLSRWQPHLMRCGAHGRTGWGDRQEQVKVVCSLSKHLRNFCIRCWASAARQTKQTGRYT